MPDGGYEDPEDHRHQSQQGIEGFPVVFGCLVQCVIISFPCIRETGYKIRPAIY